MSDEKDPVGQSGVVETARNAVGLLQIRTGAARTRLIIGYFGVVMGMFMAILDTQIVASSLTEIQAGLLAAPDEISWVQSAYLIAEVIVIPLTGWLSQVLSTRWLFAASCFGFTLASAGCALSWNIESMIAFRAIQGFVGGTMIPTMFGISFVIFGGARSVLASVVTSMVITLGPTLGPTMGGWLTATFSWHWLFLVNLVPGLMVTAAVGLCLDVDRPNPKLLRVFDYVGFVSVALFLGSLQYVLEEGAKKDWFQSDLILGMSALATVSAIVFFWRELTIANPIVDLRVFKHRDFALGCGIALALGFVLYGSTFLVPLYCARVLSFDSFQIGTIMAITGMAQMVGGPASAFIVRHLDVRGLLAIGLAAVGGALLINTTLTTQSGFDDMILPQALRGFGYMCCAMPSNIIAMSSLPVTQVRAGSGLFSLMRNLGGAIGLALLNTELIRRQALHDSRVGDLIHDGRPQVRAMVEGLGAYIGALHGGTIDGSVAAIKVMQMLVQRQAAALTFSDVQWLMTGTCVAMATCLIFIRRLPPMGGAPRPAEDH